jgi:WD40 repeat protein
MAPERFRGVTDPRGDIYALGATLYELLTLHPAFAAPDQARLIDQVTHEPPQPLRQHDRRIPRDLETLVLKALAKDPSDRFATSGELCDELGRYLESRPIRSRPVSAAERVWRWCKRNPPLATASIAAILLTVILAIASTVAAWIYRDQRDRIGRNLFESLVSQAQARRVSKREGQRFKTLDALAQAATIARELKLPPAKLELVRDEAIACLALPDLRPTGRVITRAAGTHALSFDSTMTRYAIRFRDSTIQVRRVADDQEIARLRDRGDREPAVFGLSPDGRYLAATHDPDHGLTVWDVDRGVIALDSPGPVPWHTAVFSPNSRRIAVQHAGKVLVYDLETGHRLYSWLGPVPGMLPIYRPDGTEIAVVRGDQKGDACHILDAKTGRTLRTFPLSSYEKEMLAWSPDGTTLAVAGANNKICLLDAVSGIQKGTLEGHINSGLTASFDPGGTLLASNGFEDRLWLWDPVLRRPWLSLSDGAWSAASISRDRRIVINREEGLTTYQVDPALEYRTFADDFSQGEGYGGPSIRSDGRVLAVHTSRRVVFWDLAHGTNLGVLPIGPTRGRPLEPSGDLLTTGPSGVQRWLVVLDLDRGEFRIGPPRPLPLPAGIEGIGTDRSGRIVALAYFEFAFVATPQRTIVVGAAGRLPPCRRQPRRRMVGDRHSR